MECIKCKQQINPLRLKALPGVKTCIECSDARPKKAITRLYGERNDTWNSIEFVDGYDK
tara:strand:+ start:907 stop:1083 length:177 start_codon:yes stop_codon:yes gene_type:complete